MTAAISTFTHEKELVAVLKDSVATLVKNAGGQTNGSGKKAKTFVFEQIPIGMTIPDLVIIERPAERTNAGARSIMPSHFETSVLAELHYKGPSDEEALSEALFSRLETITSALTKLAKKGAVERTGSGEFCAAQGVVPEDTQITSVEAKLRNWREALQQAKTYRPFSNYCYIALPSTITDHKDTIARACEDEGIGLISVSREFRSIAVQAKRNTNLSQDWIWLLAKTIGLQGKNPKDLKASRAQS